MSVNEFKYTRLGYVPEDTFSDKCVQEAVRLLPNTNPDSKLPKRWRYTTPEAFVKLYGEGLVWSRTASYHHLYWQGYSVLRLWTTSPHSCRIYLYLNNSFEKKITVKRLSELYKVIDMIKERYGLKTV